MKSRAKYGIAAAILAIIGSIYTFVSPKTIVSWGIGFGRHNDRVLVGILCLLVAIVFFYRVLRKNN